MEIECRLCPKCDSYYDSVDPGCAYCSSIAAAYIFSENEDKIVSLCKQAGIDTDYCGNNAVSCVASLSEKNALLVQALLDVERRLEDIREYGGSSHIMRFDDGDIYLSEYCVLALAKIREATRQA